LEVKNNIISSLLKSNRKLYILEQQIQEYKKVITLENTNILIKDDTKKKFLDYSQNVFQIDELIYEKKESIKLIREELNPLGLPTHNLYVFGLRGSGKSTLIRREVLKVEGPKIVAYVNCKLHAVARKVYEVVVWQFQNKEPRFFIENADEINKRKLEGYDLMRFFITKIGKPVFLIIDEFENIVLKADIASKNFSYKLIRLAEEIDDTNYQYTLIFLTNKMGLRRQLADDVRGATNPMILLPAYDAPDIVNILQKRRDYCLKPDVVDDYSIRLIAKLVVNEYDRDARQAIMILYKAVRIAFNKGLNKITHEIISEAHERMKEDELDRQLSALELHSRILLASIIKLIEEQNGITEFIFSNAIIKYAEFCDKHKIEKVSDRQLMNYLYDHFTAYDLVATTPSKEGKHKIFVFKSDVNMIKEKITPHIPKGEGETKRGEK